MKDIIAKFILIISVVFFGGVLGYVILDILHRVFGSHVVVFGLIAYVGILLWALHHHFIQRFR